MQVRTRTRLRHRDRSDQLAGRHSGKPAHLLLFGPVGHEVVSDDAVHVFAETRVIGALKLLEHDAFMSECRAGAAVFLGYVAQQDAHGTGLEPGVAVDMLLLGPTFIVRHELGLDELADRVAEDRQLVRFRGWIATVHGYLQL